MPDNTTLNHMIKHNGIGLPTRTTHPATPLERTVIPDAIKPDGTLIDRLAALSTWLGEFPFQQACVVGERTINEAIDEIERLRGEIKDMQP